MRTCSSVISFQALEDDAYSVWSQRTCKHPGTAEIITCVTHAQWGDNLQLPRLPKLLTASTSCMNEHYIENTRALEHSALLLSLALSWDWKKHACIVASCIYQRVSHAFITRGRGQCLKSAWNIPHGSPQIQSDSPDRSPLSCRTPCYPAPQLLMQPVFEFIKLMAYYANHPSKPQAG